jgi:hypothetical protein
MPAGVLNDDTESAASVVWLESMFPPQNPQQQPATLRWRPSAFAVDYESWVTMTGWETPDVWCSWFARRVTIEVTL